MTEFSAPLSDPEAMRTAVRNGYAAIATGAASTCGDTTPGSCCCGSSGKAADQLATSVGYSAAELATLPEGANLGLSCGNPTALAELKLGEVLVDLGSGGGFDVFLAGQRVGATGRAIGVDMTPEMLARARKNLAAYRERTGLDNAEFRLGEIEHLPLADASVDVVLSNCVINLSPDKSQVWREIYRVLKPGGRVAISDLALLQPLPSAVTAMVSSLVGCVAGAVLISETEAWLRAAGFVGLRLTSNPEYVRTMTQWQDPLYQEIVTHLPAGSTPADYITSLAIAASKPGACSCGCC